MIKLFEPRLRRCPVSILANGVAQPLFCGYTARSCSSPSLIVVENSKRKVLEERQLYGCCQRSRMVTKRLQSRSLGEQRLIEVLHRRWQTYCKDQTINSSWIEWSQEGACMRRYRIFVQMWGTQVPSNAKLSKPYHSFWALPVLTQLRHTR